MAILRIRTYPDPVLRVKCPEVATFDDALRRLAEDMIATMHAAPGVGLAAPQVGIEKRLAVVDVSVGEDPEALHVLVNPRLVEDHGREVDTEGCLSIPGLSEKVTRPQQIVVKALGLDGEEIEIAAEAFEARAICHEIDHLDGVLFVDHLRGLRRDRARRHLRKLGRDSKKVPAGAAG
jgi:peptide deformylase